jgi:hypothetical protein
VVGKEGVELLLVPVHLDERFQLLLRRDRAADAVVDGLQQGVVEYVKVVFSLLLKTHLIAVTET